MTKDLRYSDIKRIVNYIKKKYPKANNKTIKSAIVYCVKNPDSLIMFDSFEQYVDFNFGKFYLRHHFRE